MFLVLNGAFYDIPPSSNAKYRIPRSLENLGGAVVDLRQVLSFSHRLMCLIGSPRIRLMYLPGHFTDMELEECMLSSANDLAGSGSSDD
jgi:hypothetical protein